MTNFIWLLLTGIFGLAWAMSRQTVGDEPVADYLLAGILISGSILATRSIVFVLFDVLLRESTGLTRSDLLRMITGILLIAFFAALILKFALNWDPMQIIAISGIAGVLFGFATQTTMGNFFQGLAIQFEKSICIDDLVQIGDRMGLVEAVTWRSVTIRTPENSVLVIPNNRVASTTVEIFPRDELVRRSVVIAISVDVSPQRAIQTVNRAVRSIPNVSKDKACDSVVQELDQKTGDAKLEVQYYPEDNARANVTDAMIRERVWYALRRNELGPDAPDKEQVEANRQVISEFDLFLPLSSEHKQFLAERSRRLLFAPGEPICEAGQDRMHSMFIVCRGNLKIDCPNQLINSDWTNEGTSRSTNTDASLNTEWDPQVLEPIKDQLAIYMGPIASVLVARAQRKTLSSYRLYRILATDIPDAKDRAVFLHQSPRYPIILLQKGKSVGELSLCMGKSPRNVVPEAVGETELLEIGVVAFRELLSNNPQLVDGMSQRLADHHAQGVIPKATLTPDELEASFISQAMRQFHELA